ncbi:biotin transporter BioY [Aerococcaceae bacterium zg-ZUI334]|uniref:biotin transporter BioY n=1 Tax=Aerococcaceae TaxID=186827 RepID=UPI0013B93DDC|nr:MULTISPECIES: biotin transporter BioY [unclassified Facklamia]MBR7927703.1 biotin transporter BioY [Aerococcaceae bacterium zg-ZUI334]NEW64505.1 biotin transporter BioY [Facklamia sp. 252]NEW67712.1 biotin transporter BioY [Facklamia sp. 253]QQD65691.1 biotin transporter BioY [Aerococcaceae bacterium zg-252]
MKTKEITLTALLLALLIVGSQLSIPMWPVPITLQTLVVLLIGMLATPKQAAIITISYVLLGIVGLPVFAGFKSGPLLPTLGFSISFIPATLLMSIGLKSISRQNHKALFLYSLLASIVIYAIGVPYLAYVLNHVMNLGKSASDILAIGLTPFLLGDFLKIIIAILITQRVYPYLQRKI